MGVKSYDFTGWATRNDIRCADGRTIRRDAFKDCDGRTVPIVWSHIHDDPEMVLGHALLENRPEGVYMYGKLNDSERGRQTKHLIEHGDVVGLSIWANQLKQHGGDVLHGAIKEVSVVLAGANPGAFIDSVILAHGDDTESVDEAIITTGEPIEFMHSVDKAEEKEPESEEETEETVEDVIDSLTKEQKEALYEKLGKSLNAKKAEEEDEEIEHSDTKEEKGAVEMAEKKEVNSSSAKSEDDETIKDVFDTLTDKQKTVVYAMIGEALEQAGVDIDDDDEDSEEEEEEVKHNVFDTTESQTNYLSHDDMKEIFADAKRLGSLKEAVNQHLEDGVLAHDGTEATYGIGNVDYLFPDARTIENTPDFIKRNDEWVNVVMNGTHHTPFSRVKSVFADITADEARAKGYIKGKMKKDEFFSLVKRSTDPQTIYKKQKMNRDDILDITDFDVVAWLRGEMRMMLNEEVARAILIGDGRLTSDEDHISHDHIRPIATDANLYTIKATVTGTSSEDIAKNLIKASIRARKDYKGSGSPIMFTSESLLTEMMLLEDTLGHPLYTDEAALARRMRVSRIVPCPIFDNQKIDGKDLYAVIVNLTDYNIGADKGGEINMFDDFDIDYNQQKYLIETRISGALVRPYSAIVLTAGTASSTSTDDDDNGEG